MININNPLLQETGIVTAPNGKEYTVIYNATSGAYIFKRPDGSISSKTFTDSSALIAYINSNNPLLQETGIVTAPNGKEYTVIYNATSGAYIFKRPDGSISSKIFTDSSALIAYINSNNPVVNKSTVAVRQVKKTKTPTPKTSVATVAKPTQTITPTSSNAVVVPVVAPVVVPTKVNTTTAAS